MTTEMSLARLHQEVLKGDLVNVVVLPPGRREMDEGLIPIDIPLDRGVLGLSRRIYPRCRSGSDRPGARHRWHAAVAARR